MAANVVINSLTKFIGGHGTSIGGMVTDLVILIGEWSFQHVH